MSVFLTESKEKLNSIPPFVEIRFEPNDMSTAFIFSNGKKYPIRATNKNENARTKRSSAVLDYSRLKGE